ncbi:MAG: hypothetical protein HYZ14_16180 [Bacteroidetes bacterium]|nr:hypothetical protein [Bacteroidota bacterium]
MKKYLLILTQLVFVWSGLFAQSYQDDMALISAQISRSETYHLRGKIAVYTSSKSGKLIQSFEADVQKSGSAYRSRIDDTEVISNDQMLVTIDHEEKYIQVENQQKLNQKDEAFLREIHALTAQDSLLISADLVSSDGGIKTYHLRMTGDISLVEITLDLNNLSIKKMAYYYDEEKFPEASYVVVEYTHFSFQEGATEDQINGKDVFQKAGSKIVLIGAYKAYHLVNLYQD